MSHFNFLALLITILSPGSAHSRKSDTDIVSIGVDQAKCKVSEKFLSVAVDTHFIFKHNIHDLMKSPIFVKMAQGLQPAYLRIGGTAADLVIFDGNALNGRNFSNYNYAAKMETLSWSDNNICRKYKWPVLHLSTEHWLAINDLARVANFHLVFDLNVLIRQPSGDWDPTNALELIRFSHEHNLTLDWQLGNEPNSFCHVFGKWVPPKQLGEDFIALSKLFVQFPLYLEAKILGPDITAPRDPKKRKLSTLRYLDMFLSKAKNVISAVTWHQYYIKGSNATKNEFMDPHILEYLRREIVDVKSVVSRNINEHFPLWIGETASAFGGGAPNLSDRFISGFMWLDKLGMSASYNISVVVRQSLIGGHYGLIREKSLTPTVNFWISYLYKKVVGPSVLELQTTIKNPLIRLYAHCWKKPSYGRAGVVIFGINLSSTDYTGRIVEKNSNYSRIFNMDQYLMTSLDGDVTSKDVLLNGKILVITSSQELPILTPVRLQSNSIYLPPMSTGFYIIHDFAARACSDEN